MHIIEQNVLPKKIPASNLPGFLSFINNEDFLKIITVKVIKKITQNEENHPQNNNKCYSTSVELVLVTVTLSVRPLVLLPLVKAIISNISTAAPTTQTQGSAYQVCSVVFVLVLVVVTAVVVLSCAHAMALATVKRNSRKPYFKNTGLNTFFIIVFFWLINSAVMCYSTTAPIAYGIKQMQ
jgi:hypothetical protein